MYQVRKLADNIYTFEEGMRVRSFLIIGQEKAMMLDSGNGAVDFEQELPKLTSLPVILVNTHGDGDHIGRNDLFETRYIHKKDLAKLRERRPDESECYQFVKDGDEFDLGGVVLRVIESPGHTPGSIMLYDEANKVMFGGDTLTSENTFAFSPSVDHKQLAETMKALIVKNYEVETLLVCHDACPIHNYEQLLCDSLGALENYVAGKPETDIFHIKKGPLDKYAKRYIYGCASLLTEIVAKPE